MVPDARCGLRREKVAAGGLEEFQHRLVFKRGRIGEVDHHLRAGQGLFEPLAGDGVDAAFGRGGDDLVAALAQNGDGPRAGPNARTWTRQFSTISSAIGEDVQEFVPTYLRLTSFSIGSTQRERQTL